MLSFYFNIQMTEEFVRKSKIDFADNLNNLTTVTQDQAIALEMIQKNIELAHLIFNSWSISMTQEKQNILNQTAQFTNQTLRYQEEQILITQLIQQKLAVFEDLSTRSQALSVKYLNSQSKSNQSLKKYSNLLLKSKQDTQGYVNSQENNKYNEVNRENTELKSQIIRKKQILQQKCKIFQSLKTEMINRSVLAKKSSRNDEGIEFEMETIQNQYKQAKQISSKISKQVRQKIRQIESSSDSINNLNVRKQKLKQQLTSIMQGQSRQNIENKSLKESIEQMSKNNKYLLNLLQLNLQNLTEYCKVFTKIDSTQ